MGNHFVFLHGIACPPRRQSAICILQSAILVACLLAAAAPWAGAQENRPIPPHTEKVLRVRMTDQPPAIDADGKDACWKDAALADDFILFKGVGRPTQQSDVRVTYDAGNLYLFATLHEAHPDKIRTPTPNQKRDNAVHGDDCLEVFVDYGKAERIYFHLTVNAANVRYDAGPGHLSWNPTWQSATRIGKDAWYLEAAVPFAELGHPGDYAGTPAPGAEWRVNFNRNACEAREWSGWSCTYMGFHEPKNFGHLIFEGSPARPAPEVASLREGERFFGANTLEAVLANPTGAPLDALGRLVVSVDGKEVAAEERQVSLPAGGKQPISFPYTLLRGGEVALNLTCAAKGAGRPFATGRVTFPLPHLERDIPAFAERLEKAMADSEGFDAKIPGAADIKKGLRVQGDAIARIAADAGRGAALSTARWRQIAEEMGHLSAGNKGLLRRARLLSKYSQMATDGVKPLFCIATAGALDRVFEKDLAVEPMRTEVATRGARNEYESFQVVVIPLLGALKNVTLWPGDLRTADGRHWINGKHISFRVVDPVHRTRPWYFRGEEWAEWHPDILWPKTLFDVPENTQKAVWITLYTPPGTPAGEYFGRIAVKPAEGEAQYVTLRHTVWGFDLPRQSHLRTDPWFSVRELQRFYNLDRPVPLEMEIAYKEFIAQYRLSTLGLGWVPHFAQNPLIQCTVDKKGDFTYDFAGLEPLFQAAFARGTNSFNPNMGCNSELFGRIFGLKQAISKETGQMVDLEPAPKSEAEAFRMKRVVQFWGQYTQWLKRHGWLEAAMWEYVDEPNDESRRKQLRMLHTGMRKIAPGMKLFSFGVAPDSPGLAGYVDLYGPPLYHFSAHRKEYLEAQKKCARFWIYSCQAGHGNDGVSQHCPDSAVTDPALERRIYPWFCFHWDIDGFLIFAFNTWDTWKEGTKLTADPAQRWPLNGDKNVSETEYQFIYPSPDGRPVASMRLENLRDGMEDYEYLWRLREEVRRLKKSGGSPALIRQAEAQLQLEPKILVHAQQFTADPAALLARRNAIGALLHRLAAGRR